MRHTKLKIVLKHSITYFISDRKKGIIDIWLWYINVQTKRQENIHFSGKDLGILRFPVISNTQTCAQETEWSFEGFISVKVNQNASCSNCPTRLKTSRRLGSHEAEEVYSAWEPSLIAGVGSCWSLHIPLAALLTQNTLMTSPLAAEPHCEVIHVSM